MAKIESKPRGVDRGAGTTTGRDLRDLPTQDLAQTNFTGLIRRTRPDLERIQQTANFAGEVLNDVEELRAENRVTDIEAEFDKDYATLKENFLTVANKVDQVTLTKMRNQIGKGLEETYTKKFGTDTRALRKFKERVGNKIRFNDNDIVSAWLTRNTLEGIEKNQANIDTNYNSYKTHKYQLNAVAKEGFEDLENQIKTSKSRGFNLTGQTSYLEQNLNDVNAKSDFYFQAVKNTMQLKYGKADPDLIVDFIANDNYGSNAGFSFTAKEKEYIGQLAKDYQEQQTAINIKFEQGKINSFYNTVTTDLTALDRNDPDFTTKIAEIRESVETDTANLIGAEAESARTVLLTAIDNYENNIDPSANNANIDLFSFLKKEIYAGRLNVVTDTITYKGLENRSLRSLVGTAISEKQFSELSTLISDPNLKAAAAAENKLYETYAEAMTKLIISTSDPTYATAVLRTQELMERKFAEAKKQYPDLTVQEYFKVSGDMKPGRNANYENEFLIENFNIINPVGESTKTKFDLATGTLTTVPVVLNNAEEAIVKLSKKEVQVGFNKPQVSYLTLEDLERKNKGADVEDDYFLLEEIVEQIITNNLTVEQIEEEWGKEVAKDILIKSKSELENIKRFETFYTGRTQE